MKFNDVLKEDGFVDSLMPYKNQGGDTLNIDQLGYLVYNKKISPYAIVKKEKELKKKLKKSKKEIGKALYNYYTRSKK